MITDDSHPRTPAWLVVWECHCSDVQVREADLPERCPGHDRGRITRPEHLPDALVEYVGVHDCGPQACGEAS